MYKCITYLKIENDIKSLYIIQNVPHRLSVNCDSTTADRRKYSLTKAAATGRTANPSANAKDNNRRRRLPILRNQLPVPVGSDQ